jgi:hypothetical protein
MQIPQEEESQKKAETQTKQKISLANAASWTLLGIGVLALIASIIYVSSILALIGLGLTFWGVLLLYAKTQDYTRKLLYASLMPTLSMLNQLIQELNYSGKPVYLPPKYFQNPDTIKIYIPKRKKARLPKPEEIQKLEKHLLVRNPHQSILLTPPGAELTKLLENTLETNFTTVDLKYLQQSLPKLLVEDFEIADNLEFQIDHNTVKLQISNSIYSNPSNLPYGINEIGNPLQSAIACAITKATGKPVTIEKTEVDQDNNTTKLEFRIIGMEKPEIRMEKPIPKDSTERIKFVTETQMEEAVKLYLRKRIEPIVSIALISGGSIILAFIGWLMWYDITVWGKDIAFTLFGSRTGEAMSLGIGMQAIHYLLIAIALLLSGIILSRRKLPPGE